MKLGKKPAPALKLKTVLKKKPTAAAAKPKALGRKKVQRRVQSNPQGYNGAYNKAYDEAYDKGFNDGYTKGLEDGALDD